MPAFADLPLLPSLQATLAGLELHTLTDVQAQALPALLERQSVVAIAETGSGKTLTYVLPVLDRLKRMEDEGNRVDIEGEPRAIVLVPTRELGEQVAKVFKTFTHGTRLRVRTVLGGTKLKKNRENVSGLFEVLVATPGRIEALLERSQLSLDAVRIVVLDEADQLLDKGFLPGVERLIDRCPTWRQLVLLSATMSDEVQSLIGRSFADALQVRTAGSDQLVPTLRTVHVDVPDGRRFDALERIMDEPVNGGTLLFANTRDQCDAVVAWLAANGHRCAVFRGEMEPTERRRNLKSFRDGELNLLVATDMGARGLDIERVVRVINVHLPREREAYLHRVGRTARAGRRGLVVNLVTPRDAGLLKLLDDGHAAPAVVHPPR